MEDFEKQNDALESEQDSAAEAAEAAAEAQEAAAETAENAESEVVDTTPETESQTEETAGVETDAVSDTAEAVEPAEGTEEFTNEVPVPVKKKKIQTPIIIAAIVLVLALIGGAVFFLFFNNSVVGTWVEAESASADEASGGTGKALRYYTFEKDGTAKISLGTMQVVGTWSYANDDSSTTDQPGNTINVAISYFFTGTFKIDVQGNAITGKTLELEGYGRVDFLLKPDGSMYALEANTLPGMTNASLIPQEANAAGISYEELCDKIVECSMKKYN
jgi:flagellar basal body-associated protein FliL